MSVLNDYLDRIKNLNIVPPVLIGILSLSDDNELSFDRLEKMVESDQILVTRMLTLANSPFFSRGNKITALRQIITRLGFRTVRSMVAVAMADSIFSTGNYQKFREEVWDHSISCGVIAQHLAVDFGHREEKDIVLVVGLLSDLGKIVLNTINRTKYIEVLTEFRTKGGDILEIERKHFKIDSAEIGPAAAEQWKLPANVIELMRGQTLPVKEQSRGARLVGFAGLIARKTGHGRYVPEKMDSLLDEYFNLFNIYSGDRERFIAECEHRLLKDELYQFCQHL